MSQTAVETLSLSAFTGVVGRCVPKIWMQPEQQSHEYPSSVASSETTRSFVLCKHSGLACSQNLNTTRTTVTRTSITSCLFWEYSVFCPLQAYGLACSQNLNPKSEYNQNNIHMSTHHQLPLLKTLTASAPFHHGEAVTKVEWSWSTKSVCVCVGGGGGGGGGNFYFRVSLWPKKRNKYAKTKKKKEGKKV